MLSIYNQKGEKYQMKINVENILSRQGGEENLSVLIATVNPQSIID